MTSSTPNYCNFMPLAQQAEVLYDMEAHDYSTGAFELLMSGSVGSAKSLTLAHIIVDHCLTYDGAAVGIGRLALPRLKETLCQKINEHLYGTGINFKYNESSGAFKFGNGSKIIPFSWTDKKYEKFRSYDLSAMVFEELSENHGEHQQAYKEAIARVGRRTHIPVSFVASATNPDSPSHWAYEYFMESDNPRRKVYYSLTSENPFLPPGYIETLMETYDEKMIQRMIFGQWVEINSEVIYYTYEKAHNFINEPYQVVEGVPVCLAFDFNIALGKPLSLAFVQHHSDQTHVYNEVTIEGLKTGPVLEEAWERGLLPKHRKYIIHGDRNGKNNDTRGPDSDYDIIKKFMRSKGLAHEVQVPSTNPGLKVRHNLVNGRIKNAKGQRRLFVYKDAPMADKGFRLTALKKGANYIEDDSNEYQHITTAIGYSMCRQYLHEKGQKRIRQIQR